MANERIKTEHAGAKNGGGAWMKRADAKDVAKRQRREEGKQEATGYQAAADVHWERETLTGEPMPDVAAAVRRSRESH